MNFLELSGEFLRPFSVAFMKGWRRSVTCLIALEGIRTLQISLDDISDNLKVPSHFLFFVLDVPSLSFPMVMMFSGFSSKCARQHHRPRRHPADCFPEQRFTWQSCHACFGSSSFGVLCQTLG